MEGHAGGVGAGRFAKDGRDGRWEAEASRCRGYGSADAEEEGEVGRGGEFGRRRGAEAAIDRVKAGDEVGEGVIEEVELDRLWVEAGRFCGF